MRRAVYAHDNKREQYDAIQPHHIAPLCQHILHQTISNRQKERHIPGNLLLKPASDKPRKRRGRRAELSRDQHFQKEIHLIFREQQNQQVEGRGQIIGPDRCRAAPQRV